MIFIGVDLHPEFEQIAFIDTDTGERRNDDCIIRTRPKPSTCVLVSQGKTVHVGTEASGHARWFERLLGELQCIANNSFEALPTVQLSLTCPLRRRRIRASDRTSHFASPHLCKARRWRDAATLGRRSLL